MFSQIQIAPSLLSADFLNLERDVRLIEKACPEWLHVDVMDGHFVPNLTIGPPIIRLLKQITTIKLDVHLMISNPAEQLDWFLGAGADLITIHIESSPALPVPTAPGTSHCALRVEDPAPLITLINRIHAAGILAGISLNPGTPVSILEPFLSLIDLVLVMSVHPGFGGQSFIESSVEKIEHIVDLARSAGVNPLIEVDGGISAKTAPLVTAAGADVLVAGNAIFGASDPLVALQEIRRAAQL